MFILNLIALARCALGLVLRLLAGTWLEALEEVATANWLVGGEVGVLEAAVAACSSAISNSS